MGVERSQRDRARRRERRHGDQPFGADGFWNELLFNGVDTSANGAGLWAWNGTSATELVTGIDPHDMTVFNGEVLFNGPDTTANGHGLWAWNGTSATELIPGLDPSSFEIFNGKVLFSGFNSHGNAQLFETDGTAGGTRSTRRRRGGHGVGSI